MNHHLSVSQSIDIKASPSKIWEVLTDPKLIAEYLFGTETITNWKVGRAIVFQGEYQGHKYQDKGMVVENKPHEILSYNYWSGFSGLADTPENYALITYALKQKDDNITEFTWTQKGFPDEDRQQHSLDGMPGLLEQIKEVSER